MLKQLGSTKSLKSTLLHNGSSVGTKFVQRIWADTYLVRGETRRLRGLQNRPDALLCLKPHSHPLCPQGCSDHRGQNAYSYSRMPPVAFESVLQYLLFVFAD